MGGVLAGVSAGVSCGEPSGDMNGECSGETSGVERAETTGEWAGEREGEVSVEWMAVGDNLGGDDGYDRIVVGRSIKLDRHTRLREPMAALCRGHGNSSWSRAGHR